jgi:hypothetical protein
MLADGMLRVWSWSLARRYSSKSPWNCSAVRRRRRSGGSGCVCSSAQRIGRSRRGGSRRRRRVMPALFDDAGQAGAGHGRVAELVLDHRERLRYFAHVVGARSACDGTRRRRGEVDAGCNGEAKREPGAGGGHERRSTAGRRCSSGPAPHDFAGNGSIFAHAQRGAQALPPRTASGSPAVDRLTRGKGPFPAPPENASIVNQLRTARVAAHLEDPWKPLTVDRRASCMIVRMRWSSD